jgi:hypothetical protein
MSIVNIRMYNLGFMLKESKCILYLGDFCDDLDVV